MKQKYLSAAIIFCGLIGMTWTAAAQLPLEKADLATTIKDFQQLDSSQKNQVLGAMGVPDLSGVGGGFTWAKIIAWFLFGSVGFIAFVYGKKQEELKPLLIGLALMGYPYFTNNTIALYAIGVGLCGALYYFRD